MYLVTQAFHTIAHFEVGCQLRWFEGNEAKAEQEFKDKQILSLCQKEQET